MGKDEADSRTGRGLIFTEYALRPLIKILSASYFGVCMLDYENNMPNFDKVSAFIEKPSYKCSDEKLIKGINDILVILKKNPQDLIKIISSISSNPDESTFNDLFCDLVVKMLKKINEEKLNEVLEPLFSKCFKDLIENCIYNIYYLEAFTKATPHYLDKVMNAVVLSDTLMERLFANSDKEEMMEKISMNFPSYKEYFSSHNSKSYKIK